MMNLYSKFKNYITKVYLNGHYPSIINILFSKKKILIYYGFLGDRNFGDEWVYESAKILFKDFLLIPYQRQLPIGIWILKNQVKDSTVGVVIGGGTLIGKAYYFPRDMEQFSNNKLPVFLHGTGVHDSTDYNSGWRFLLNEPFYGGVRGPISSKNLLNVNSKVRSSIIGDAAFYMNNLNDRYEGSSSKTVLINIGAHKAFEGMQHFRSELFQFIKYLFNSGYEVKFLPFHIIDVELGREITKQLPQVRLLQIPKKFEEVKKHINKATFVVGERLHLVVSSLIVGCPIFSVNYSQKHCDLLKSINSDFLGNEPSLSSLNNLVLSFNNRHNIDQNLIRSQIDKYRILQNDKLAEFSNVLQSFNA